MGVGLVAVVAMVWLWPACDALPLLVVEDPDVANLINAFNAIPYAVARDALAVTGFVSLGVGLALASWARN